ncbi:hypothetical protein GCM10010174_12920 [Kutzneria viridogrisea]|uniref:Uncharacterized protein n=2 Tax=Kutzneria TaxID=43356 RepID=W5WIS6_9PSEU|nr:hypothetical protein [Kutzneria albida]AHI01104.1 hypothetical protein KALB_7746 [Kutzneria albida DSM 43870]MBA8926359.1 hypothetical protein [Kutzneria viridogrisea]
MSLPIIWWRSAYDDQVHAFPLGQITEVDRRTLSARCTHSAPKELIVDTAEGMKCMRCILLVGAELPDPYQRAS